MSYNCVILAAGFSSRMGSWKPVMKLQGKSLIQRSIDNASAHSDRIIVAGGYRFDELVIHLADYPRLLLVENRNFEKGMMTSLKAAIPHIQTDYFFVTLADMPFISPETFRNLENHACGDVLFPVTGGRRGHPVLFSRNLTGDILASDDDAPIRQLLLKKDARELEVNDPGILLDIDTPGDYNRIEKSLN